MTIHRKKVLTDIDGVCLNWLEAYERYMVNQGYKIIGGHTDHKKLGDRFGISFEETMEHVEIFNSGHWEFGTLRPEEGAVDAVKYLHSKEYELIGITSCSTHPQTVALRKANLYNVFGPAFSEVHCVSVGESKTTHLSEHDPCFWIEDKATACVDGLVYGHKCILMDRPWNGDYIDDRLARCYSWQEVIEFIESNS